MSLTNVERELVALGAALGSNCVPCIEHHIPAARAAGLDDRRIQAAIAWADQIRQVPARKVLAAATDLLRGTPAAAPAAGKEPGCPTPPAKEGSEQPCCA